jgi:hypothetical protein
VLVGMTPVGAVPPPAGAAGRPPPNAWEGIGLVVAATAFGEACEGKVGVVRIGAVGIGMEPPSAKELTWRGKDLPLLARSHSATLAGPPSAFVPSFVCAHPRWAADTYGMATPVTGTVTLLR